MTEGTILEWHVKVGDEIKADATIVEISTDKVDVELPAPASGTVTELLVEEGDTVTVGQVIARIAVGRRGAGLRSRQRRRQGPAPPRQPEAPAASAPEGVKVSPVAARAAAAEGVSLAQVSGKRPGRADHEGRRPVRRRATAPRPTARRPERPSPSR